MDPHHIHRINIKWVSATFSMCSNSVVLLFMYVDRARDISREEHSRHRIVGVCTINHRWHTVCALPNTSSSNPSLLRARLLLGIRMDHVVSCRVPDRLMSVYYSRRLSWYDAMIVDQSPGIT